MTDPNTEAMELWREVESALFDWPYYGERRDQAISAIIAAKLAELQAEERTTITSWLRSQATAGDKALFNAIEGGQLRRDLAAGVVAINRAITAIETGEHLKGRA